MSDFGLFFGGMVWGAAWLFVLQQTLKAIRKMFVSVEQLKKGTERPVSKQ